jgi:NNP family nitrate/nitrite transporter-like MFS transporter
MYHAITSPRTWVFFVLYGYCFGVELTVDNIIAEYFYDRFDLNLTTAGTVAAVSGLMNLVSRPIGGFFSDKVSRRGGMRGRLWYLWFVQTTGGFLCILLGRMSTLGAAICVLIFFSVFVQAACGATFGIVPFISRRSLGGVIGFTAAGGNVGSAVTQALFFTSSSYHTETGLVYMGAMIMCVTTLVGLVYFPMWGGMFFPPKLNYTEEEYYVSEWNAQEQRAGLHIASLKFAINSRCERRRDSPSDPELDDPNRSGLSMFKSYSH